MLEILARLDAIGSAKFDRDVAEQIFQQCPQRNLGDVTVEDFADQYANGIVISRRKIARLKETLEEDKARLHKHRMLTDDMKEKDKLLPAGKLFVTMIEKCWS